VARRAHLVSAGWRNAACLMALAGFGFKAGLVPPHVWLPEAHPVAPADGSAFLSGLIVKLSVYGIALFALRELPEGALAFSTIENIGFIVTASGAAMTFLAYGQRALWAILLLAGLYHVLNHGYYKTLLFLEAGVTEHAAGSRLGRGRPVPERSGGRCRPAYPARTARTL
jgi:formate hydrogenlyase subunit 3/multisubunit Na+/H+ antiporter MnhD subunit